MIAMALSGVAALSVAQTAQAQKWEAVSIKPCSSNIRSGAPALSPGRMTDSETVFGFIYFAYKFFASGRMMKVMHTKAEGGSLKSDRAPVEIKVFSLDELVARSPNEKYIAPDAMRPSGTVRLEQLLVRLRQSRSN